MTDGAGGGGRIVPPARIHNQAVQNTGSRPGAGCLLVSSPGRFGSGRTHKLTGPRTPSTELLHEQPLTIDPDSDLLTGSELEPGVLAHVRWDVEDEAPPRVLVKRPGTFRRHGPTDYINVRRMDFTTERANRNLHALPGRCLTRGYGVHAVTALMRSGICLCAPPKRAQPRRTRAQSITGGSRCPI